ncbi:aspartic protease [Lithospermum erythrorhizon]|uniref:Aspartic proteinase Asp1 n=1 Tax=Lithospermum erythrorhizon TaxID=34254 RepID=A0AAV3R8G7_LITER
MQVIRRSLLLVLLVILCCCSSSAFWKPKHVKSASTVVFPVHGNVYPKGYYHVTLYIGQPPKPYFLDIDTGSDLTWLQCDAPCARCTPAPHSLYKPKKNVISCQDPLCTTLHSPVSNPCEGPQDQCDYEVAYADQGSSIGVLVKDVFPLKFTNGTGLSPRLAFGCGYNQEVPDSSHPYTDGVLGLGSGESSILGQLADLGLTRNIVGHCLSARGGGFLFVGDDLVPSGVAWAPLLDRSPKKPHSSGSADIFFGGKLTEIKDIPVVFDSGSTYSYFSTPAYNALLSLIKNDLKGKQLNDANNDRSLPVCWKGIKAFQSVREAMSFFKPIELSFPNAKNAKFQLQPEAYLIASKHGNVCLGILNGSEVGLEHINVIGDIFMLDKMVIYDYEKEQIGWFPANCDKLPKS